MGWTANATVCAAEGHRGGRQRRFTTGESSSWPSSSPSPPGSLSPGARPAAASRPPDTPAWPAERSPAPAARPPRGTRKGTLIRQHAGEHRRRRRHRPRHGERLRYPQRRDRAPVTDRPRRPAPGTWQYNLNDGHDNRAARGRIAGKACHLDVLKCAAGICAAGYQPGTIERGLLEQFAAAPRILNPAPGTAPPGMTTQGGVVTARGCGGAAPPLPQPNQDYNKYLCSI